MKENSLYASLLVENADEAGLIDAWLDERLTDLAHRRVKIPDDIASTGLDEKRLAESKGSYDEKLVIGQIRILSKRFTGDDNAIPYVAVLERWQDDMWLVAPFSHYSHPATPGEMTTGIRNVGLRVIQAWNARTIQTELLAKSFAFGQLEETVVREAAALFRNQLAGTKLPEGFSALRGPAIIVDADPRREYVVETIERFRPLSTAVHAMERMRAAVDFAFDEEARKEKDKGSVWQPFYGREDYALAAGEKEVQRTEVFKVEETELSVTYSPEDGITIFTFYGHDDEPDNRYDGYGLIGCGKFLGTFRNGTISVSSENVKDWYQIVDCSGQKVVLVRK